MFLFHNNPVSVRTPGPRLQVSKVKVASSLTVYPELVALSSLENTGLDRTTCMETSPRVNYSFDTVETSTWQRVNRDWRCLVCSLIEWDKVYMDWKVGAGGYNLEMKYRL